MRSKIIAPLIGFVAVFAASGAYAHVKWFVEFDVADPPRPLSDVLNPTFFVLLLVASLALFATYVIDTYWTRSGEVSFINKFWKPHLVPTVVRVGTGIFFVCLWLMGSVVLTPEMETNNPFIGYVHFFTAFFLLFSKALILSALGIVILYGYGIYEYGIFHMLDYAIFIGLAFFLATTASEKSTIKQLRVGVLYFSLVFSFLWSAIEKFAYVEWFQPFLDANEFLTMGMERNLFLMCAAFVEFTLVFVLLTGRNMVILGAIALNALIIAAAIYFGKVDAIGHWPVIVTLTVFAIRGAYKFPILRSKETAGVFAYSAYMLVFYWGVLAAFFALYYGFHGVLYKS